MSTSSKHKQQTAELENSSGQFPKRMIQPLKVNAVKRAKERKVLSYSEPVNRLLVQKVLFSAGMKNNKLAMRQLVKKPTTTYQVLILILALLYSPVQKP